MARGDDAVNERRLAIGATLAARRASDDSALPAPTDIDGAGATALPDGMPPGSMYAMTPIAAHDPCATHRDRIAGASFDTIRSPRSREAVAHG